MPRRPFLDPRNIQVIDDVTAEYLRRKTGAEKLKIASDMHAGVRSLVRSYLAVTHPEWDQRRLMFETCRTMLGDSEETMRQWMAGMAGGRTEHSA
jgi:hypothetical protein